MRTRICGDEEMRRRRKVETKKCRDEEMRGRRNPDGDLRDEEMRDEDLSGNASNNPVINKIHAWERWRSLA